MYPSKKQSKFEGDPQNFFRVQYLDDIEKLAGIFVKNGYAVRRSSIHGSGRSMVHGIQIDRPESNQDGDDED